MTKVHLSSVNFVKSNTKLGKVNIKKNSFFIHDNILS